jgi:hypothetical protein
MYIPTYFDISMPSTGCFTLVPRWRIHAKPAGKQHQQWILYTTTNTRTLFVQGVITSNRFYCITKRGSNHILINLSNNFMEL